MKNNAVKNLLNNQLKERKDMANTIIDETWAIIKEANSNLELLGVESPFVFKNNKIEKIKPIKETKPVEETKEALDIEKPKRINLSQEIEKANNNLKVIKNDKDRVVGEFNGVLFETSPLVEAMMIFDPTKWDLKESIVKELKDKQIFNRGRLLQDQFQIERSYGYCREMGDNKYTGYVTVDNNIHVYVFNSEYGNNPLPATKMLEDYIANPKGFKVCSNQKVIDAVRRIVGEHKEEEIKFDNENRVDRIRRFGTIEENKKLDQELGLIASNDEELNTDKLDTTINNSSNISIANSNEEIDSIDLTAAFNESNVEESSEYSDDQEVSMDDLFDLEKIFG